MQSTPYHFVLWVGGYSNLQAASVSLISSSGYGTSCPHCTVELFLDGGNQGRYYLDTVSADASGNFTSTTHYPLPYLTLNATTTDHRFVGERL